MGNSMEAAAEGPDGVMTARDLLVNHFDQIQKLFPDIVPPEGTREKVLGDDGTRRELFTKVVDRVFQAVGDDPVVRVSMGGREDFSKKPLLDRLKFLESSLELLSAAREVQNS